MFSISVSDWVPFGANTGLHAGSQAFLPPPHELNLPGKPYRAYGVMVTIPMKGSSRLEFSYDTLNANGNILAPTDLGLFGGAIAQGEPLHTTYSVRHLKMSYNFLTYPNPPQDAKLRFKTLWEFHYLQLYPGVTATVTAPDQPLTQSQRIILPAVDLPASFDDWRRGRQRNRPHPQYRNLRGREIPALQDVSQERHLHERHDMGTGRRRALGVQIKRFGHTANDSERPV
jgi:hypothetical protein